MFAAIGYWPGFIGLAGAIGLLFAVLCPIQWLPGLAFVSFALLPITYMPQVNPLIGRYFAPAVFLLVVWYIRSKGHPAVDVKKLPRPWFVLSILLLAWASLTILWSIDAQRSVAWVATLAVVFIGPAWMTRRANPVTIAAVTKTWLLLGLALGSMAILEGLLQVSFLAPVFSNAEGGSVGVDQVWSTARATTTLGHPLMNATFFATTAAFAIIKVARSGSKLAFLSGAACTAASIFTVSRSAVSALAFGLLVGVVAALISGGMSFGRKLFWSLASIAVGVAVLNSPLVIERSNSIEGQGSTYIRATVLDAAFRFAAEDGYRGAGAGSSPTRSSAAGLSFPLENAYAGILVSLGVFGTVVFILLLGGMIIVAIRRGLPEIAAGTAAFAAQAAAYPLFDNVPVAMIVLGMLAYLTFGSGTRELLKSSPLPASARGLAS